MSPSNGTPLSTLPNVPANVSAALQAAWITTAEQFVAAVAAAGGTGTFAGHLGLPAADIRRGLEAAEAALTPDERERLGRPADTRDFGLGAITRPPG